MSTRTLLAKFVRVQMSLQQHAPVCLLRIQRHAEKSSSSHLHQTLLQTRGSYQGNAASHERQLRAVPKRHCKRDLSTSLLSGGFPHAHPTPRTPVPRLPSAGAGSLEKAAGRAECGLVALGNFPEQTGCWLCHLRTVVSFPLLHLGQFIMRIELRNCRLLLPTGDCK